MPTLISCPECAGKLRVAEALLGKKVRCPTCKVVFVAEDPAAAVEELDELEELVEEPRQRKSTRFREDEDEEEDRPRQRRRPVDEDEDDDYDDRPRRRRRAEDDEDEDDWDDKPVPKKGQAKKQLAWARLGALLIFIYAIVALSSIGILFLLTFLRLLGVSIPDMVTLLLVGLPGLGGVITGLTGMVFTILGPPRKAAFGLAIAATATGALHLLLLFVSMINSMQAHQFLGGGFSGIFGGGWGEEATAMLSFAHVSDMFGQISLFNPLSLFIALIEVGSLIVTSLYLRAVVLNFPSRQAPAKQAIVQVIITGSAAVLLIIMGLIFRALMSATISPGGSFTGLKIITWISVLLNYGIIITVYVFLLMLTMNVKSYLQRQKA